MAGRFPGARDIDQFWENLKSGIESIQFFTSEALVRAGVDPAVVAQPNYVPAAGTVDDVEWFDAGFFGYSPRDAARIDPQQRVLLEIAWAALENAGYVPEKYRGAIGVYAGSALNEYLLRNVLGPSGCGASGIDYQTVLANDKDFLTTRISYKLALSGPSVAVQTACSTSLVAIHLACQALVSGECDLALAGGVTIRLPQNQGYLHQPDGAYSPDGHCRAFDDNARGCNPGSGAALVALKRLSDALADGDFIHAVVKGTAINNDGAGKVGYTAPSVNGQAFVIRSALAVAETKADTIGYVETHGTGTILGDPIEIEALTKAFREDTGRKGYCAIGSVKTNVGHLDAAAGVTGFIKAVLSVRDGWLVPSLHFERPNRNIDFDDGPFYVATALRRWSAEPGLRRAGVSSFGVGGTNAHVVLEQPPDRKPSPKSTTEVLLTLSAKSRPAVEAARIDLAHYLRRHSGVDLADVAFTLQRGRADFRFRNSLIAADIDSAITALESPRSEIREVIESPRVAFLFPGQGSQYPRMLEGLYGDQPEFRRQVDEACEILKPRLGHDLRDILYPAGARTRTAEQRIYDARIAQPAVFVVSYALARLWMSFGIRPTAMLGHSLGEYVAACLSGVMSLPDALALVAERGRLTNRVAPGSMMALPLAPEEVTPLLGSELSLAAVNAPALSVVSGPPEAVGRLRRRLLSQGVEGRMLHSSRAFHSAMMEPIVEEFAEQAAKIDLRAPEIPFVSSTTGTWITADEARDPGYWGRHLRNTVRFSEALAALSEPPRLLLEVGPGRTLATLATRQGRAAVAIASARHHDDPRSDHELMLLALGGLWSSGAEVDWDAVGRETRGRRVPLPAYPFQRERFWIESRPPAETSAPPSGKRPDVSQWFYVPSWQRLPSMPAQDSRAQSSPGGVSLVLADGYGLGAEIASRLEAKGERTVTVEAGRGFARTGERRFEIDPQEPADYQKLVEAMASFGLSPSRVVHCWGVEGNREPASHDSPERPLFSLLFLVQALVDPGRVPSCRITVVTTHVHSVTGDEDLCPEKAMVLGPCRVIPLEYPGFEAEQVDVVLEEAGSGRRRRLVDLLEEGMLNRSMATVQAIRGGHRWAQTFTPIRLEPPAAPRFRERGVYLVTGGLGGVGLAVAEHLARTQKAKLVLTGRTPIPERRDWQAVLEAEGIVDPDSVSRELTQLEEQKAGGLRFAPMDGYHGLEKTLDDLCASYVLSFLTRHEIDLESPGAIDRRELRRKLGIAAGLDRYFENLLRILSEDGFLASDGDALGTRKLARSARPPRELEAQLADRYPEFERLVDLLRHCTSRWDEVLRGEVPALSVLYGEEGLGRFRAGIENALEHSYVSLFQELIGTLVSRMATPERKSTLRILEVGGGEGVLTKSLAPLLRGRNVTYRFTDIGRSFVGNLERYAEEEGLGFMECGVLDVSRPMSEQGLEPGSFDVVLAFNVVHATPNIARTLSHLKEALSPGGWVVLLESVKNQRWIDLVWGLTDGWWAFVDDPLRRSSPLIDLESWQGAAREQGFEAVMTWPHDRGLRSRSDCGLVVGRKPFSLATSTGVEPTTAMKIRAIHELEALGAEVEVASADVADANRMGEVLSTARRRFGAIHGVIHAALVLNDGPMQLKTRGEVDRVLSPKVRGTRVLEELLAGQDLDFFALFSSLVSVLGGSGQVDYCAASNFQDAFAQSARNLARFVVSMDWGAWREVGKAMRSAVDRGGTPGRVLLEGMTTAEGVDAFIRALSCESPQVLVSPEELRAPNREPKERAASLPERARPPRAEGREAPRNDAERIVANIWQELLGIESVGIHDNFFELGGDSVVSLQFIARARQAGLEFKHSQVFEHQTIAKLVDSGEPRESETTRD